MESHKKYLGLPTIIGKSKKFIFSGIQDRLWKKINGWKERCLAQAGRDVLIKSVAQAVPNYVMSCFKIPIGCCTRMEQMMRNFWWGSGDDGKKICWIAWDTLCKVKREGGLGIRNLQNFNDALLGKQVWRLMTQEHCLMARILKARYYPRREEYMECPFSDRRRGKMENLLGLKMFLWKLCHNGIPTKQCLRSRGINTDPICFMCMEKEETTTHLFLDCKWVRRVWFLSQLGNNRQHHPGKKDWGAVNGESKRCTKGSLEPDSCDALEHMGLP